MKWISLLLLLCPCPAWAFRLSAVGVANFSERQEPGTKYSASPSFGVGALLESRFGPPPSPFGLEFGVLSLERKYKNDNTTTTQKLLEFPVVLRVHVGSIFSLGFGGYYAKYRGAITEQFANTAPISKTYAAERLETSDYGFVSSLAIYFPIVPGIRFLLDGRYTISTKNNHVTPGDTRFNDLQALGGIQIGF